MSLTKIFKEQRDWMDKAIKNIETQKMSEKILDFPETLKVKRRDDIQARISVLKKQKEEAIRRYDQAIAEQEKELVNLENAIDVRKLQDLAQNKGPLKGDSSKAKTKGSARTSKVKEGITRAKKLKIRKDIKLTSAKKKK